MSPEAQKFAMYPGGQPGRAGTAPRREYHELWFRLARIPWASIVLVPADDGTLAADVATALAEIGTSLQGSPVTAIVAQTVDYGMVRSLVELQPRLGDGAPAALPGAAQDPERAAWTEGARDPAPLPPSGRAIIAIQPVVDEPLGIAIARAADAVVLCIDVCRTRLGAARRTIDLVGADRVFGALVVR